MASSSRSVKASADPAAAHGTPHDAAGLITVGRVIGPHGLRGEVRVRLETDFPERFTAMRSALLVQGGRVESVAIIAARPHRGGVLLSVAGVGDVVGAERLRGAAIAVPRETLAPLADDSFYVFEVIGLRVRTAEGEDLGRVAEVMRGSLQDIYVVHGDGGEILLPAVRQVIRRIDLAAGLITVDVPVGLRRAADGA